MAKGGGQQVNRKALAGMFGISLPTVDAWVTAGCPYVSRGTTGRQWVFDTADVARWREQRAADEAGGGEVQDEAALKRRRMAAETAIVELELLQKKALVAPLDQVERSIAPVLAEIQSNLRGTLIARLVAQLLGETDARKFKRVALAEIDVVLDSLSRLDLTGIDDEDEDDA